LGQTPVAVLEQAGVAERLPREGLAHNSIELAFDGQLHRINFEALTGKHVTVYGQTEVTHDLMDARAGAGLTTVYEAENVSGHGFDSDAPSVRWRSDGAEHQLSCDFIAAW